MRNWLVGFIAAAIWLLCFYGQYRPQVLNANAPAAAFSAGRADAVLARLLGPERPHPTGSPEDAAVHARVQAEFARLGIQTDTLSTMSCYGEARWRATSCAQVSDIIGEVAPGSGPAIVLMAHMDSVAAGPGAGDDESDVALIMETIRAWKARGLTTQHPILALITDGEENAMLGASAFLRDPSWRARVGVVINLESRGNRGRSFLFQTSPGDGALVNLYARSALHLATSSLYAEIYKRLPNDTDLTPFLAAGFHRLQFLLHRQCRALSYPARPAGKSRSPGPATAGRIRAGTGDIAGGHGFRVARKRRRDLFRCPGPVAAAPAERLGAAAFAAGISGGRHGRVAAAGFLACAVEAASGFPDAAAAACRGGRGRFSAARDRGMDFRPS